MNQQNIEKIITTSFPSKTDSLLKFVRSLDSEQKEWIGLLMMRAYKAGKDQEFKVQILFND